MFLKQNRYIYIYIDIYVIIDILNIPGLSDIALSDITLIPNKFINEENEDDCFHFIIRIPYAGRHLKWELFFDPDDLDFPPDFDFNDNHFLENPDEDIIRDNIPSLLLWNLKSSRSLSQVLQEFLILYKNLQVSVSYLMKKFIKVV